MELNVIIGNIFSFLYALCIAISVIKKNKTDLMFWQVLDIIFSALSNIALCTYSALASNAVGIVRNYLTYKNKLTKNITYILFVLCIVTGLWANNRGMIGLLPVIAVSSYTICLYTTKNAQQMRWALVPNLLMWFVHDVYVQAYPAALINITLSIWTAIQIYKNHKGIPT